MLFDLYYETPEGRDTEELEVNEAQLIHALKLACEGSPAGTVMVEISR